MLAGVPTAGRARRKPSDRLHQKTGAVAVDMESHIVAGVAGKHAIPMAAIRVVTDPAVRACPGRPGRHAPDGTTDLPPCCVSW